MSKEIVSQDRFWREAKPFNLTPYPDRISVGDDSAEVLSEIIRINPLIAAFSVKFYNPFLNSGSQDWKNSVDKQQPFFLPRYMANKKTLSRISYANYRPFENGRALAVCSKVMLKDGEIVHLKMLDFKIKPSKKVDTKELISLMNSSYGALMITENSYHFWGTGLLSSTEWYETMRNYSIQETKRREINQKPIYDSKHLEHSLKVGYSALRIFRYDDVKTETPQVVELVK